MQNQQPSTFDLSFAHVYNWNYPKNDVMEALSIMLAPGVTEDDIEKAASGKSANYHEIRWLIAGCPNTPAEVLEVLAQCAKRQIVARVAGNPQTPAQVLAALAAHEDTDVRCAVAENISADCAVLKSLLTDENIDVRFTLAENHNLSAEILEELARDDNPYVAHRAQRTLGRIRCTGEARELPTARPEMTKKRLAN